MNNHNKKTLKEKYLIIQILIQCHHRIPNIKNRKTLQLLRFKILVMNKHNKKTLKKKYLIIQILIQCHRQISNIKNRNISLIKKKQQKIFQIWET